MKKTKLINSLLVSSLLVTTPVVAILTSCNKKTADHITLIRGSKEIYYTDKTKSASILFETSDVKDIDSLKVKAVNIVASGAEAKAVAGLLSVRKDSAGHIAVIVHVSTFKKQWPNASITFDIRFTSKDTGLDQTISGFSLSPVESEDRVMEPDAFDVMASEEHEVKAGEVYTYTCTFPSLFVVSGRYDYFSFIKTKANDESEFVPISDIRITKNGTYTFELGFDYKFTDDSNSVVHLTKEEAKPQIGDEYIFEVVYAEDGYGKFLNAARQSCLEVEGTVVKGFRQNATEPDILEEFPNNSLRFYRHITGIADNAFNYKVKTPIIPTALTTVSFERSEVPVTIGNSSFAENKTIDTLVLPLGQELDMGYIQSIGDTAFAYCTNLTSDLDFTEGLTTVGAGAFNHCEKIESLYVPKSCTDIGIGAFSYMNNLNYIDFTAWDSVPTITSTGIFKESGIGHPGTKGSIVLNSDQYSSHLADWTAWLTSQQIDWELWEIVEEQ